MQTELQISSYLFVRFAICEKEITCIIKKPLYGFAKFYLIISYSNYNLFRFSQLSRHDIIRCNKILYMLHIFGTVVTQTARTINSLVLLL